MRPSETELILLRTLWASPRLGAREIHEQTQLATTWSYSTTRKTLDRLVEKGLVEIELVHGLKTFKATRGKIETLASLIHHFSAKILNTKRPLPAAMFAASDDLTEADIDELDAHLDQLANGEKE